MVDGRWNYRIHDLTWIYAFLKEFSEIIQRETVLMKEPQWLTCIGD